MASPNGIPSASLLHVEDPLAAIVLKHCRETHCHFCFNEIPADVIFCRSCTIPVYCSQSCQVQATGDRYCWKQAGCPVQIDISEDLARHIMDVRAANTVPNDNFKRISEHRHECGGVHWSAVLPPDIVLAGRVAMQYIEEKKILDCVHHYQQSPPGSKLELHIYAIVLSFCLRHYYRSGFACTGASVSQLVLLICQIKINSMAIVHIKSMDGDGITLSGQKLYRTSNALTSSVEQVRVAQAIYSTGSLFNHSCQPNLHAYFLSRTLHLRSTEFVPAGNPLELSYGPQVGQMDLLERQKSLEEQYCFKCRCSRCSELSVSDLIISSFRCSQPMCLGAVVEMNFQRTLEDGFVQVSGGTSNVCKLSLPVLKDGKDMEKVANKLLRKSGAVSHIYPGYCLSCSSYLDLNCAVATSNNAISSIQRLKDSIISSTAPDVIISEALEFLGCVRSLRHPYSKVVAEAEDYIAEAFVKAGDLEHAAEHCKTSIKILEKLYQSRHIVIGHELIKLATIQLSLGDNTGARNTVKEVEAMFSLYYGPHWIEMFPYVDVLREQTANLVSCDQDT